MVPSFLAIVKLIFLVPRVASNEKTPEEMKPEGWEWDVAA
jgi:hypothetical protein